MSSSTVTEPLGGPPMPESNDGWLRRHLRVEDALLFAATAVIVPALFPASHGNSAGNGPDAVVGLLDLVGLLAFVACLVARSQPGVTSGLFANGDVLYAVGPLFGALAFTIDDTAAKLGLQGSLAVFPIAAGIGIAVIARRVAPPLSVLQRRALVTPFILVTSRFFGGFLAGLTDIFDLRRLAASLTSANDLAGTAFVVLVGATAVLVFYVMLVFAPRQVADREGTPRTWAVRFLLFLVSFTLGQTFGGLLHPG